jgi:hypothetical protein
MECERSRPFGRKPGPESASIQIEGMEVRGRPAVWGGSGRETVGSGAPAMQMLESDGNMIRMRTVR